MGIYTPIIGLMTIPHTPKNHHGTKNESLEECFPFQTRALVGGCNGPSGKYDRQNGFIFPQFSGLTSKMFE